MVKTLVPASCLLLPLSIYPPHGCIFRMLQPLCPKRTGYGLDICPIVQNVHGKRMPGTMPAYMFVYSGSFTQRFY